MKWLTPLLICILFSGCASRPKTPKIDFGGIMFISVIEPADFKIPYLKGIFQVKGTEDEFYVFFQDEHYLPSGRLTVIKGEITEEGTPFDTRIKKTFKYWPYLFYTGEKDLISSTNLRIQYLNRTKVGNNYLPSELEISIPELKLNIKIKYGN